MESIKELRERLQKNQLGHPILQRVLSIYITRAILPTRITANQVTAAMLLVGVASAIPFFFGYIWLGLALSYLCILLDATDGEVARYRKAYSLKGIYLDLINHLAIQAWFFLGLGYAIAQYQSGYMYTVVLVATVVGALSFPLRRANGDLHREIYVHHYTSHPERFSLPHIPHKEEGTEVAKPRLGPVGLIKKAIYYSEYHAIMLVIIVLALLAEMYLVLPTHPILAWLIVAYATVSCLYLVKEIIEGYRYMENRVAGTDARLKATYLHGPKG